MKVHIHDNLPAAGPARSTYFETRLRRALVGVSHLVTSADVELGEDPQDPERSQVQLSVVLSQGTTFVVTGRRRGLASAAAHAFECLAARLSQLGPTLDEDDVLDDIGTPGPSRLRMRSSRPAMR